MKKRIFLFSLILIGLMGMTTEANAQAARVAKEVVKGVGKAASKNKKSFSEAAKKTAKKTPKREKTARPVTVTCPSCNGGGYVSEWDAYYQRYIRTRCRNCNGTGKVTRVVRY